MESSENAPDVTTQGGAYGADVGGEAPSLGALFDAYVMAATSPDAHDRGGWRDRSRHDAEQAVREGIATYTAQTVALAAARRDLARLRWAARHIEGQDRPAALCAMPDGVTPERIGAWLLAHRWTELEGLCVERRRRFVKVVPGLHGPAQVSVWHAEFVRRSLDVVCSIATYEGLAPAEVLAELLPPGGAWETEVGHA